MVGCKGSELFVGVLHSVINNRVIRRDTTFKKVKLQITLHLIL